MSILNVVQRCFYFIIFKRRVKAHSLVIFLLKRTESTNSFKNQKPNLTPGIYKLMRREKLFSLRSMPCLTEAIYCSTRSSSEINYLTQTTTCYNLTEVS